VEKLISPQNKIIVKIERKYYDQIKFRSGIVLYKDTSAHPEDNACIEGTVISVPRSIICRPDYDGYVCDIEPGCKILMRYDVIYSYTNQPDRDTPVYKNLLYYEGQEYWQVDIQQIFAVVADIATRMLNGYIQCRQVDDCATYTGLMVVPFKMEAPDDLYKVIYSDTPGIASNDIIITYPSVAQRYQIDEEVFYILRSRHVLAKIVAEK
jgi:hypothetical protein